MTEEERIHRNPKRGRSRWRKTVKFDWPQYSMARRYAQLLEDAEHRQLVGAELRELQVLAVEVAQMMAADESKGGAA